MLKNKRWTEYLRPEERELLEWLIHETRKLRCAYKEASDVKNAEIWSAMIVLLKRIQELEKTVGQIKKPMQTIVEIGEEEKRKAIEKIIKDIIKPTDQQSEEVAKKLVDTLMEF